MLRSPREKNGLATEQARRKGGSGPDNRTAVLGSHLGVATEQEEGPSTVKILRIRCRQQCAKSARAF